MVSDIAVALHHAILVLVGAQCFHLCHSLDTCTGESCPYDLFSISVRISGENNTIDECISRGNSSYFLIDCVA